MSKQTNRTNKFKKLLIILSLGSLQILQAASATPPKQPNEFILNLDNVQAVKQIVCERGLYYVIVDIDDNENEKVPLYKTVNNKEVQATCGKGK
jgi:hypothetical protein